MKQEKRKKSKNVIISFLSLILLYSLKYNGRKGKCCNNTHNPCSNILACTCVFQIFYEFSCCFSRTCRYKQTAIWIHQAPVLSLFLLRCCSVCPLSLSSSRSLFLWLSFGFFFFFFFPLKCLVLMCCNFFFFLHHFVNWLLSIFFLLLCCSFPLSFSSTLNMNASKRFNLHYLSSTVLLCVVGNTALLWDINPDTKKKITIMGHGGAGIGAVTVYREQ